jgi:DNA-binding MarR family transcriptional regulator
MADTPILRTIHFMGASQGDAPTRRMFAAFLRAAALVEPLQREIAARHGISLADLHALRVLELTGEVPVSRLGAELGLRRSSATNLVDRLERAGLVERAASPEDRRVTLVHLSPNGFAALESFALIRESEVVRRLLALDEADQAAFTALLERVAAPAEEIPA